MYLNIPSFQRKLMSYSYDLIQNEANVVRYKAMTIAYNHVKEFLKNSHYDTELCSHNTRSALPILCSDHFCVALATA